MQWPDSVHLSVRWLSPAPESQPSEELYGGSATMSSGPKGWNKPKLDPSGMIEVSFLADTREDHQRMQVKFLLMPHQARELGEQLAWSSAHPKTGRVEEVTA
jgi:hypothetical protein